MTNAMEAHRSRHHGMGHSMEEMRGGMKGGGPRELPTAEELIDDLDENGDGTISIDEAKGPLAHHFDEADADGNGLLSQTEIEGHRQMVQEKMAEKMAERMTGNEDPMRALGNERYKALMELLEPQESEEDDEDDDDLATLLASTASA
ncbi:MAG: hypothetical protein HQL53_03830 [Magnetococcales bacterium]|nr:hypothetical protein [Magnetococcales bacterium]